MAINRFFHNFSSSDKMNTRNKIVLSGLIAVFLAMSLSTVLADTQGMGTDSNPGISAWVVKKSFSFCQDVRFDGDGSVLNTGDVQTGCINPYWAPMNYGSYAPGEGNTIRRAHAYAFTGEQVAVLAVVRDSQGAADLQNAFLAMGEMKDEVVQCIPVNEKKIKDEGWRGWSSDAIKKDELKILPRVMTIGDTQIEQGFDEKYDMLYECILTVTDDMSGNLPLYVEGVGGVAGSAYSDPETFDYNPAITLLIGTTNGMYISFPVGAAGKEVYSENKLTIKNQGLVDIAVWLGGTDLTASSGYGLCPTSNVLDSDNIEFACKLNDGMGYIEQKWQEVKNVDTTDTEGCYTMPAMPDESDQECFGVNPLFASGPYPTYNMLVYGQWATCDFKLSYPEPCIGTFDQGDLVILMRAI